MAAERKEGGTGSNAMEQFLVLANSAKGLGAVELIKSVLQQSTVFSFGELIDHPNIKALESTESRPWLTVLKIFAYGTYRDYKSAPAGSVPELNPKQLTKLKQLTIVSKASVEKTLTYAQLMQELDVSNVRELEDLIIDCIYSDLIVGKLDQKRMVLDVQYANACDIGPQDMSAMTARLASWIASSDEVLTALEQQMKVAEEGFKTRVKEGEELKKAKEEVETKVKQQMEKAAQKRQGPAGMDQDAAMAMQMQMGGLSGPEWGLAAANAFFGGGNKKKPATRTVK